MAQELVLVPKIKYEHLLRKLNMNESVAQSGGAKEEKQISNETVRQSDENEQQMYSDDSQSKQNTQNVNRSNGNDRNTPDFNIAKPSLYVEAPLSKMGFSSKLKKFGSKNRKPITRRDIKTSKPIIRRDNKNRNPITRRDSKTNKPIRRPDSKKNQS